MDEFEKLVFGCQKYEISRNIENSAWRHALVLFKYIFKDAEEKSKNIYLVTGALNSSFYNELFDMCEDCFEKIREKAVSIDIVVLGSLVDNAKVDNKFLQYAHDSGWVITELHRENEAASGPHFILAGDNCYRVEVDHNQTKAIANFNDKKTGGLLKILFDDLKSKTDAA